MNRMLRTTSLCWVLRKLPVAVFSLLLAVAAGPARADGVQPIDEQRVAACLATHPPDLRRCLFSASTPCQAEEISRAANPHRARIWCDSREMLVWRKITETVLQELLTALPDKERAAVEAQQADWVARNGTACVFPYAFLEGGWVKAEHAGCELEREHERAAELLASRQYLEAGEFGFQAK